MAPQIESKQNTDTNICQVITWSVTGQSLLDRCHCCGQREDNGILDGPFVKHSALLVATDFEDLFGLESLADS